MVSFQLAEDYPSFVIHHSLAPVHQILHGEVFLLLSPISVSVVKASVVKHRFAECLAGNSAPLDAAAANGMGTVDDNRPFAQLGRLNRRLLPRRAGSNDCDIVVFAHSRLIIYP